MLTVRTQNQGGLTAVPPIGPKRASDPACGSLCPACGDPLLAGDYTTLVALGPGRYDTPERIKAAAGEVYSAVAVECHFDCVTGASPAAHAAA